MSWLSYDLRKGFFDCTGNSPSVSFISWFFQRSSMVEQRTVNAHVVGSNPTAGAKFNGLVAVWTAFVESGDTLEPVKTLSLGCSLQRMLEAHT